MTALKAPELLLPAGSLDKMRAAYDFGADAVYAGQPRYSLRARNNEFRLEQIRQGIAEAHARGKKFFVTSNVIAHNDKIRTYLRDIEPVIDLKPGALIMADAGLIMMVKDKWPEVPVHLSVQANTTNWAAVKFWQKMGVGRAGLLSLAALAGAALWAPGAGAQLGPEPPVRHVQGSWVNLRERPRSDARVEAQLPANTVVRLLAEQDGWCEVFYTGDDRLNPDGKGEVIRFIPFQSHMACNLLAAQPLTLPQAAKDPARAFWVAPSPNRLRAYGNALPRPATLQMSALQKSHAEGAEVRYPARPEFDAAKRLLRAGVLLDTAHEIARGKPVPDPVADLKRPGLRLSLQPIAPSRFKRHGEVALLHDTEADGLAAVAGSRIAVVPTAAPMGRYNRHNGPEIEFVTGFWDVGAADLVFDPPLTVYAITQQGLVGAQALRKRSWQIDNADFYCGGNYTGPAFADPLSDAGDEVVPVKRYARLPETAQVLTRLATTTELPASAVVVKAQRQPMGWTIPAEPPEVPKPVRIQTAVVAYEIDLDRDGIADILRIEVPFKGEMSGHPIFAHHWYLNVGGQWFRAGRWIDQECT